MKVLFLNPGGQLGGAERSLLFLMSGIRAARPSWNLELIAGEDGPLIERALELGVRAAAMTFPRALARLGDSSVGNGAGGRVERLALASGVGRAGLPGAAYLYRLRSELARRAPDVIHSNGLKMHLLGAWARRGTPLIWHIRDFVGKRALMSRLMHANASRCSAAIANSNSVAEDLRRVCGNGLRIEMIYNAVDLERFNPRGEIADLDRLAGMDAPAAGTIRVGLIATLARWKGHRVFLEAIAQLASKLESKIALRAYVIGGALYQTDGSQYRIEELRAMAAEMGVEHVVGFTGFVEDTAPAMRALDIIVHASALPEPFGLAIAEGMACGKAVVVSGAGGAAEIVEHEVDALVYPPGDVDALAKCIERLATDVELRARIGAQARVSAEARFTRERLVASVLAIYEGIASAAA